MGSSNIISVKEHNKVKSLIPYTYEEAVERIGVGKFHYFLLFTGGMSFTAFIAEIIGFGILIFPAKCDLKFSLTEQGLVGSAAFLGVALSSHAFGFLADTWGRLRTLRLTTLFSLITSLISAISEDVWTLFVFRFLTGFFIAGCQSCVFSFVGEFHSAQSRTRHVAMIAALSTLGVIMLPVLAVFILPMDINFTLFGVQMLPWRILVLLNTIFSIISLFGFFSLPESPKFLLSKDMHNEGIEILRQVYASNTGNPKSSYPCDIVNMKDANNTLRNVNSFGQAVKLVFNQTIAPFVGGRALQTINMCLITFTINLMSQGTYLYVPKIINNLLQHRDKDLTVCQAVALVKQQSLNHTVEETCIYDPQQYIFLATYGCIFITFYILISYLISVIGKIQVLVGWMSFGGLLAISLHWVSNFYMISFFLTIIVAASICIGIMTTIAIEFYPVSFNAMGVTLVMMIGRIGAAVGTNIVGPILLSHCDSMFFTFGGVIALLCCCSLFLPRPSKK